MIAAEAGLNWIAGVDDLLLGTIIRCTLCQRTPVVQQVVWPLPVAGVTLGIAAGLCRPCHRQPTHEAQLTVVLAARYRARGDGE